MSAFHRGKSTILQTFPAEDVVRWKERLSTAPPEGRHSQECKCLWYLVSDLLFKEIFFERFTAFFFPLSISLALWQPNLSGVIFIFCCDFCSPLTVVELLSGVLGAATLHVQLETLRKVSNIWAWQTNSTSAMSIKYSLMILFSYDPVIGAQYDFWQLFCMSSYYLHIVSLVNFLCVTMNACHVRTLHL